MKKIIIIVVLGLLVFVSGCKVGPDFVKPEYQSPAEFRYDSITTDTVVNLRWWEIYNDKTLDTLIRIALAENKNVLIAAARIEAARAAVGYTRADQFPTVNVLAGVGGGNYAGGGNIANPQSGNWFAYPELVWEIDFWGKYRRSTESARADLLATEYGRRTVQLGLISAVASTYFQYLDDISKWNISKQTVESRDSALSIIQARYNWGVVSELELNQAQIQRAIAAVTVPVYRRYVAFDQSALSILLGRNPDTIVADADLFNVQVNTDIPTGIPSQLLERRPDILEAQAAYESQNAKIGVAVAMRFPSISLTALLGAASPDLQYLTSTGLAWSVGGSLLSPLFQFGKNKRRVEIERYNTEAALLNYESSVLQALKDVEDALITITTLKEELIAQKERYDAAINAEMLSMQRYDRGVTSYLEVVESQRYAFEAQLSYSQTNRDLLTSYIQLYKALGGGWISEQEEQAAQQAATAP
ncbi:MAG TPA: efflux transporter outer membrane subunit [Bacteroidales bacterium]